MNRGYAGNYVTPDTALKQSEQFLANGDWQAAVQILNLALQNRRIKGNNSMMERIMVSRATRFSFILTLQIAFRQN